MAVSKKTERANTRLAIILGLVALGIFTAFLWKNMS